MTETKIIVLDDGPSGSQTVHSCLLLTRWDQDTLHAALLDDAPLFFILTNTRGMDALPGAMVTREVCRNLILTLANLAAQGRHFNPIFISRLDSTLRGHYPMETDVMNEELGCATGFDAHFLIPAFLEGGRFTRDSIHYLVADGFATPVHQTEFARDSVFGYSTSYLPDYVEEKTAGRIKAYQVERFLLTQIRGDVSARLLGLHDNVCGVVDAETQADLNHFAAQLKTAIASGKRFLFRSAASLIAALAQLPPQPVAASAMRQYVRNGKSGAVIVGSHVKKTTAQLNKLLKEPGIVAIEVNVDHISMAHSALLQEVLHQAEFAHAAGTTPVIYTSRAERGFADQAARLAFGEQVSAFLMDVVRGLPTTLGFLISKGGSTSHDVLSNGLALKVSRVLGQLMPGCSVVRCPSDHPRYAEMLVVIFPGNVGDDNALTLAYHQLTG